ncbi:MAG TPA: hypothetical protein VK335_10020 [Bryobacteraceae bacterium]|nr:hypothetical protein [Bryobacteraceae bacterium]
MRAPSTRLRVKQCLSPLIAVLLAAPSSITAQQPAVPAPAETKPVTPLPMVQNLKVVALAGNGEMNDLERRVMAPLVVEVVDLQDRPIEGAEVVFRFPLRGPSAVFADQKSAKTVRTNGQGEAAATGWTANNEVGSFQVHVTATYGNQMGETTISMSNAERVPDAVLNRTGKRKTLWSSKWFKIGLIAGGAGLAAGIVLATRGGGGSTSTPTITVSPGSPSVGGPP